MCPPGGALLGGRGLPHRSVRLVCHCLLIEAAAGLVLVETGLGTDDVRHGRARHPRFVRTSRPQLDLRETAAHQIEALGFRTTDVRHIVLTHLDVDHAGGIADFPDADVHLLEAEWAAATRPGPRGSGDRYRPMQWAHGPRLQRYSAPTGERWFGFDCVRQLRGLDAEVLLVPLQGHTEGHAAVAVRSDRGWLLHAGDAYFHPARLEGTGRGAPLGLRWFERRVAHDAALMRANQARLRALAQAHGGEVRIFCAHDASEFDRLVETQAWVTSAARASRS